MVWKLDLCSLGDRHFFWIHYRPFETKKKEGLEIIGTEVWG